MRQYPGKRKVYKFWMFDILLNEPMSGLEKSFSDGFQHLYVSNLIGANFSPFTFAISFASSAMNLPA
jgi:hypothetical protein